MPNLLSILQSTIRLLRKVIGTFFRMEALGLARDLNVDTLAQRLREEAVGNQTGFPGPVMVGGFARKA